MKESAQSARATRPSKPAAERRWRPYPAYRDSGVEWLGRVPEHWAVKPLSRTVSAVGGATPSTADKSYWQGTIPWVSAKDMKGPVIHDTEDHLTEKALRSTGLHLIQPPAVLMVVRGMILAHTVPVATIARPLALNQDMKALLPSDSLSTSFLAWLLRGHNQALVAQTDEAAHGTRCLRTERWKRFLVALPPPAEQRAIAAFLDREVARIDALAAKLQRSSALLREYRQALITAAVTGQIDVRDDVPA